MPELLNNSLSAQDTIHLLAKLRTRLVTPSNLVALGCEVACRGHLVEVIKQFHKAKHGLTYRSIDNKDKENYTSIALLVNQSVEDCLKELNPKLKTMGTRVYLRLMRDIRDAFFNKSLSPLARLYLIWKAIFFLQIWRSWLASNGYSEDDHFITSNAYTCIELNGHMIANLVYNVAQGSFPPESLRIWLAGSQACEQLFRLLRSMTPTFSTIVNFSLKGIMDKIHKLQYVSASECDDNIIFPRVKRRLLHLKEESERTFSIPSVEEMTEEIIEAKLDAIQICKSCDMDLSSYEDKDLVKNVEKVVQGAIEHDHESSESSLLEADNSSSPNEVTMTREEVVSIKEDLSVIKLRKAATSGGIPTYEAQDKDATCSTGKTYTLSGKNQGKTTAKKDSTKKSSTKSKTKRVSVSPFVQYEGAYIRKSTALYLLQENCQISSDRLMRVRSEQPSHIFTGTETGTGPQTSVKSGVLCIFTRVDCEECLLGRIIQFSYLAGSKKERQYSSDFVDLPKESYKSIGVYANWFQGTRALDNQVASTVSFKPVDLVFTPGYLSVGNYVASIDDSTLVQNADFSFSVPLEILKTALTVASQIDF